MVQKRFCFLEMRGTPMFARVVCAVALLLTGATRPPEEEIRAIWVTRWDYRAPSDVQAIVANCARLGMTDLFFQVRGNATVFYPSRIEPWGFELHGQDVAATGRHPGWDPLQTAVQEARRHGIRLHAYINVLPGWRGRELPPHSARQVVTERPDWFMVDSTGRRMEATSRWYSFLNPSHPDVRRHLRQLAEELAQYDLDGLHLDYVRFPYDYRDVARERFPGVSAAQLLKHSDFSYDRISVSAAHARYGQQMSADQWNQFRRDAVTQMVEDLRQVFKARRGPQAVISASVLADLNDGMNRAFQDSRRWARSGTTDWLVPMNYNAARFDSRMEVLIHELGRRAVREQMVVGIDCKEDPAVIRRQIAAVRAAGARGYALFAYSHLFENHRITPKGQSLLQP